jgi:hypothetical protein
LQYRPAGYTCQARAQPEDTPPVPALHLRMWADGSEAALVLITSHVHPNDAPFEKGRRHKQYD